MHKRCPPFLIIFFIYSINLTSTEFIESEFNGIKGSHNYGMQLKPYFKPRNQIKYFHNDKFLMSIPKHSTTKSEKINIESNETNNEETSNKKDVDKKIKKDKLTRENSSMEQFLKSIVPKLVEELMNHKNNFLNTEEKEIFRRSTKHSTPDSDEDEDFDVTTDFNNMSDKAFGNVNPCVHCDAFTGNICWFNRQIGEALTFALNLTKLIKESEQFSVKWIRIFGNKVTKTESNNQARIESEIDPVKSPWNIVIGDGGKELRLSPITDTDIDRNRFIAEISKTQNNNNQKPLKQVEFRVNIFPTDFGAVHDGEELNINIENFITLPEEGVTFEWGIEKSLYSIKPLPSNMKISRSGRSVNIKELKGNQNGILTCIMYSSTGLTVAKRRFTIHGSILKVKRSEQKLLGHNHFNEIASIKNNWNGMPIWKKRTKRSLTKFISSENKMREEYPSILYVVNKREVREILHFPFTDDFSMANKKKYSEPKIRSKKSNVTPHPIEFFYERIGDDDTLNNVIPKEVVHVKPDVEMVYREEERSLDKKAKETNTYNCMRTYDCGPEASCIFNMKHYGGKTKEKKTGVCQCNPEYIGDGIRCHKAPNRYRRTGRVKRQFQNYIPFQPSYNIKLNRNLFYSKENFPELRLHNFEFHKKNSQQNSNAQKGLMSKINERQNIENTPNHLNTYSNRNLHQLLPNNENPDNYIRDNHYNNDNTITNNRNLRNIELSNENPPNTIYINQNIPPSIPHQHPAQSLPQLSLRNSGYIPQVANNKPIAFQPVNDGPINKKIIPSPVVQRDIESPSILQTSEHNPQQNENSNPPSNNDQEMLPPTIVNELIESNTLGSKLRSVEVIPPIPLVLTGDDNEAFLIGICGNKKFCSPHGDCLKLRSNQEETYCRCNIGFRGNGIFCWEIADYIPESPIFQRKRRHRIHWNYLQSTSPKL